MDTKKSVLHAICPNKACGKRITVEKPSKPGIYRLTCPHCGQAFRMEVKAESPAQGPETLNVAAPQSQDKAGCLETRCIDMTDYQKLCLVQPRKFLSDITHPLAIGDILIGRVAPDAPSDISINDSFMSARSVRITTSLADRGLCYKLTVLHATNPCYFNDRVMAEGESVYLKAGDTFKLGKTKFILKKQ